MVLPKNQIRLGYLVVLSGGVVIEGGYLLFEKNAIVSVQGTGGSFSNTKLTSLGGASIVIDQEVELTLKDCSFDVPSTTGIPTVPLLCAIGTLSVQARVFNGWNFRCNNEFGKIVITRSKATSTENRKTGVVTVFQIENHGNLELWEVEVLLNSTIQREFEDITELNRKDTIASLVSVYNAQLTITNSKLSAPQSLCLRAVGASSVVAISHTKMADVGVGVFLGDGAKCSVTDLTITESIWSGIFVGSSAEMSLNKTKIGGLEHVKATSKTQTAVGLRIAGSAVMKGIKLEIQRFSGFAVVCQGSGSRLLFEDFSVSNCGRGRVSIMKDGEVKGKCLKIKETPGPSLQFRETKTVCQVTNVITSGSDVGVLIVNTDNCTIRNLKCTNMKDKGVHVIDSSVHLEELFVFDVGTKGVGIFVSFLKSTGQTVILSDCKILGCDNRFLTVVVELKRKNIEIHRSYFLLERITQEVLDERKIS